MTAAKTLPEPVRVGVIGTGGMGVMHCESFRRLPGVTLAAVYDVDQARAAATASAHGDPLVARTLDELFDAVDAVSVVTPDRFHLEPALAALARRKHLLCEKPLAPTLVDAREIARAARVAAGDGVVHMVNFSYRGSGGLTQAIAMARAGRLGALRQVHSWYQQSWLAQDGWGSWTSPGWLWRLSTKAGSGGVLGDLGCHIIDLTTAIAGDLQRVRCVLRTFPKRGQTGWVSEHAGVQLDANDLAIIECDFAGGALGVIQASRWATGHGNHLRCEVHGVDGAVVVDLDRGWSQLEVCTGADAKTCTWKTETVPARANNWQRFIAAVRGDEPVDVDLDRGAQIQAYLDACERSAVSGGWETIADWL